MLLATRGLRLVFCTQGHFDWRVITAVFVELQGWFAERRVEGMEPPAQCIFGKAVIAKLVFPRRMVFDLAISSHVTNAQSFSCDVRKFYELRFAQLQWFDQA